MDKLNSFLKNNYDNDEELIRIIKQTKIRFLTLNLQKNCDKKFYNCTMLMKKQQENKYSIFKKVCERIISYCDNNGLKAVFLKGLFLASDLYEVITDRMSNDIDILISIKDFPKYDNLLKELGFKYYHNEDSLDKSYLERLKIDHVCYAKKIDDITVLIELHGCIINAGSAFIDISQEFINKSKRKTLLDLNPYILTPEYNVVFLMLHFYKHLPQVYFDNLLWGKETSINISNLNDIVLLIQKENINWNEIIEIAKKMFVVKYVIFVSNLINSIFGVVIDSHILDNLYEHINSSHCSTPQAFRYGMGRFLWLMDTVLDKISKQDIADFLRGNLSDAIDLRYVAITTQDSLIRVSNYYEFKVGYSIDLNSSSDILQNGKHTNIFLSTKVNREYIQILYNVENKKCCFFTGEEELWMKDGIELLIVKRNLLLHRMFTFAIQNNECYIIETTHNNDKEKRILDNNNIPYEFFCDGKNFSIKLNIPWAYLNVNILDDDIIPFNIGCLLSHPETGTQYNNYKLFNNKCSMFEFAGISGISFDKKEEHL